MEASARLERSRDDRVLAGVCGGLGRYLGVDPVLLRIGAVLLVFAGGTGLVLYVIGWIVMPEEPDTVVDAPAEPTERTEPTEPAGPGEAREPSAPPPADEGDRTRGAVILGLAFVALGAFFLVDEIWPDFLAWKYIWPLALIAVGVAVLVRARR